ncbi:peptidylprolyl isomerase [Mesorhizobium sp. Z1-4]|uniref:peptidylprolyl isomerase n=1 Tax=Mesorhizobium sp. Z1-4 TaxID=2448478 RepID=UPI000FD764DE|nr:peptidylprolyl isomerase [Mesorhizobium sp. Z1-4]
MTIFKGLLSRATVVALTVAACFVVMSVPVQSAEIKYVVNKEPITSYDIQRRTAMLRLMQRGGNIRQIATDEMIDQVLRNQEVRRLRISISNQQVDSAYERFAKSNGMSVRQMDGILGQSGVTKEHFKAFIRSQMGWGQAVSQRSSAENRNIDDAVRAMMQDGQKPSTTEYVLQQVILVVPERERRSILSRRKREAQTLRQQMTSCDTSRAVAATMLDVSIRDLGRVLEPELPPEWEKPVKAAQSGTATSSIETERGVEFLLICSTRQASDDKVAQLLYQQEQAEKGGNQQDALGATYTAELRKRAQIVER